MSKLKDIKYLFTEAWRISKEYLIITLIKSLFKALIPLINISGIGIIISALTSGDGIDAVSKLIFIYLLVNLLISLFNQGLSLWNNFVMRKASNILQYKYIEDSINIDYHYVKDGNILNLKKKSMSAHPVFFMNRWGDCFNFILQFIGVLFIFSILSPMFISIILLTSAITIGFTIYTQNLDFKYNNEKVKEDRKLDYMYDLMIGYKYAKEIRINNADEFIGAKYKTVFKNRVSHNVYGAGSCSISAFWEGQYHGTGPYYYLGPETITFTTFERRASLSGLPSTAKLTDTISMTVAKEVSSLVSKIKYTVGSTSAYISENASGTVSWTIPASLADE